MRVLVLAVSMVMIAASAAAQERPLGSNLRDPAAVVSSDLRGLDQRTLARRANDDFGRCVVLTRPKIADAIVAAPAVGDDGARPWPLPKADVSECLTTPTPYAEVSLSMTRPLLRGAVYRALYTRAHEGRVPTFAAEQPDWAADLAGAADMASPDARNYLGLRALAACVIGKDAQAVHQMLHARAGDAQENEAFARLSPLLSGCLPDGYQITLSKGVVVAVLAEAAHRMALPQ